MEVGALRSSWTCRDGSALGPREPQHGRIVGCVAGASLRGSDSGHDGVDVHAAATPGGLSAAAAPGGTTHVVPLWLASNYWLARVPRSRNRGLGCACSPEEPRTGSRPWPSVVPPAGSNGFEGAGSWYPFGFSWQVRDSARLSGIRWIPLGVSTTAWCRSIPDRAGSSLGRWSR